MRLVAPIVAVIAIAAHAQVAWQRQSPLPYPPMTQPHVDFFRGSDGPRGYMVGEFTDVMLETTDGGVTWHERDLGTGAFNNLFCLDDRHGWLVGDGDVASWRTTDAGVTWQPMSSPPVGSSHFVTFINPHDGWVTANGPNTFFSHDGGDTWQLALTDAGGAVIGGSLVTPTLALGKSSNGIIRSTDGGLNWTQEFTGANLIAVQALSPTVALATQGSQILRSTDAGDTWNPIASATVPQGRFAIFSDTHAVLWQPYQNRAQHTTDAGATWQPLTEPFGPFGTFDVVVIDDRRALAVAQGGRIYGTDDAGVTWTQRNDLPGLLLWDAAFSTPDVGVAVGNTNIHFITRDGGQTWNYMSEGIAETLEDIEMWDATHGIAVGGSASGSYATTDDGGTNWTPNFLGGPLNGVSLVGDQFAVAVGEFNTLAKTFDRGQTWQDISANVPRGVSASQCVDFISATEGWVGGGISGYIIHTTDGGDTWTQQRDFGSYVVRSIEMFDSELGLAGGSAALLFRTETGGDDGWEIIDIPTPFSSIDVLDVGFASRNIAWIVGEAGFIARSEDSGRTWTRQDSGTDRQLYGLHVISEDEAWVAVGFGSLLHTTDAGQTWNPVTIDLPGVLDAIDLLQITGVADQLWTVGSTGNILHRGTTCRADFDGDGQLTIFDFLAFQNAFDAGDASADFDGDGSLTIFDFLSFQNEFDAGCE